jgi:integrase
MQGNDTQRTSATPENSIGNGATHRVSFVKVLDSRKRKIRGLWQRGSRYYAQMTVTDPTTGKARVQRIPLVDTDDNPPRTVPQAVAVMNALVVKRRQSGLEARSRRAPRFAEYTKTYMAGISAGAGTKKPRTVSTEQSYLNIWCRHLGDLRLDQIRKVHIGDFTTRRLTEGCAPRTVNLAVTVLRNVLSRAVDDGLLPTLPIAGLKPLKVTRVERRLVDGEAVDRLCAVAVEPDVTKNGQQFADYLRFLQYTGAREQEALKTRWTDVDFERGQLTIGASGDTKNRSARIVDFNPKLRLHLEQMRQRYASVSTWLFPSPQRGEQDRPAKTFRESLKLVRLAAGFPRFGFHDLRHHFVSTAVMAGIDFMTIARWVGHRDGGVLIGKVYGHLADDHRKRMADRLTF